jgi:hypothetical protein
MSRTPSALDDDHHGFAAARWLAGGARAVTWLAALGGLAQVGPAQAQAARQASGQVAAASIEPQMAMATLSPDGQRDAQHWVRYGNWPAGVPVVVTAIDSGRTVRARTAGGLAGSGAGMVYSAGVGAALGLNPDRPTALLVRMDTAPGPAPALTAPAAVPGPAPATSATASLAPAPAAAPPAAPAPAQVVDRSVPAKSAAAAPIAAAAAAVPSPARPVAAPAAASAPAPVASPASNAAPAVAAAPARIPAAAVAAPGAPAAKIAPTPATPSATPASTAEPRPAARAEAPAAKATAPAGSGPSARPAAAGARAMYLQLGAFADEKNAWTLFAKVRALKLPEGVKSEILQLDGLHRVRVGPFESRAQRDAVSKQLEDVAGVTPIKLRL